MPVNNCTCQKLILKVKERLKSELETEAEEEVVRIKNVSNMHAKAITREVLIALKCQKDTWNAIHPNHQLVPWPFRLR